MTEITEAAVDAAREELLAAKESGDAERIVAASEALASVRSAWRQQEVDAGRRGTELVGGDAVKEG